MDDGLQQRLKVEFNFPQEEWEKIGCPTCHSPFHGVEDCPQTKTGEPKFRFKTRKEMKVKDGSLPFKFRIEVNPEMDDEVEIARKRSLLRLNSGKVYSLMGLAVKAQEAQKSALQWLIRLADELDIDDPEIQEEREKLLPIIQSLQPVLSTLTEIRKTKIKQAEEMEEVAISARNQTRQARLRLARKVKPPKEEFWIMRLPNSNVDIPVVVGEDAKTPSELFKEVADAILEKEKSKQAEAETGNED